MLHFTYDNTIVIPTHNIEQIPEDVYYITSCAENVIITVTCDATEFIHILIDLCIDKKEKVKSYIQKNSIFKRCTCRLCGIVHTSYVINHKCNNTIYMLQICATCVDKLLVIITKSHDNNMMTLLNCSNCYSLLPGRDTNDVKYITVNIVNVVLLMNRQYKTTELCRICKYVTCTYDACERCTEIINTNFTRVGSIKYILARQIILPELAREILTMYILSSQEVISP